MGGVFLVNFDLDILLATEEYILELDKFHLERNEHFAINMYFHAATDATKILTDDESRKYFLVQFDKYAMFLGTLEEHGIHEDDLKNQRPIVKLSDSKLLSFAKENMQTQVANTDRGPISHFVIRTFDQEFHVLSHSDPIVIDMGKK